MIWIDTDLIIPPGALVRLVKMSNAGMPIAAGIYRRAMLDKDHNSCSPPHHLTNGPRLSHEDCGRTLTAVSRKVSHVCRWVLHCAARGL